MPRFRWSSSFWSEKSHICQQRAIDWAVTVAKAAPLMPSLIHHTKTMMSTMFMPTVKSVAHMAWRGLPAARSTAFMPKYMWVMIFPNRMTTINSRA